MRYRTRSDLVDVILFSSIISLYTGCKTFNYVPKNEAERKQIEELQREHYNTFKNDRWGGR